MSRETSKRDAEQFILWLDSLIHGQIYVQGLQTEAIDTLTKLLDETWKQANRATIDLKVALIGLQRQIEEILRTGGK